MTPERFGQIEELFDAVRERKPEERAAALAEIEPELRSAVESLLAHAFGRDFLDKPALQNAPELLARSTIGRLGVGVSVGPYVIESKLGEGGMGEVFRAVDTRLGRSVAIKTTHEWFSDRFEREGRAIASLKHPHICTLYDVGPNYLVMELIEGETLAQRLNKPLPRQTALLYASQVAAALAEAHAKGVVHRDLKPANIMISGSGVKVLDFGLAKSVEDRSITGSRMVMGTPAYMSPEQRAGRAVDDRSDLYSFGCVLYEMLTGTSVSGRTRRIRPRSLERIVDRCREEDPRDRYQSFAELQRELAGVRGLGKSGRRVAVSAAVILATCGAAYWRLHRPPKLTDKDTIVLADFVNNTADASFGGTLRQGLAIQLEQSPFLKIMDDEEMHRVLRLMSVPAGVQITNPIAKEICVREGAAATIDGVVANLGKSYVITLQATACPNGATIAREQVEAADKEHVLKALGAAATGIRGKLGESLNSIQKQNRPLEEVTTPSFEAFQNYTAGYSMTSGRYLAAIPFFQRAIAIDPNFAMAYMHLGVAFEQAGDTARSRECAEHAFRLSGHVSENERAQIVPYYYRATGELDKEIDALQSGVRSFPRDWKFHNQLGVVYIDVGRYAEGLKEGIEAARLHVAEPPYRRQLDAYICLDRLQEARQLAQRVREQGLDGPRIHQRLLEIAYVDGDRSAISQEVQWFTGKPEEYLSIGLQAAEKNVHGHRRESRESFRRAAATALRWGLADVAAEFEEADALDDALLDDCHTARRLGRPAVALAICGNADRAEKLAAATSKLRPNGTLWNAVKLPEIRAAIALNRNDAAKSVELLASASPYERSYLTSVYLRGLAYLRLQKGTEAVAEFRKIADHKGANWGATWIHPYWGQYYSLSYLGMARGYALAGDSPAAKKAFEAFFELCKDADAKIAVLREAKTEYARLR